ncbi:MAG TPA: hypothetical protein VKZ50_00120 [bacterium]|nr:hypothetical protein [bacterium]
MPLPDVLAWAALLIALFILDTSRRPLKEWQQSVALLLYLGCLVELAQWRGQVPEWVHAAVVWVLALATFMVLMPVFLVRYMGDHPEPTSGDHQELPDPGRAVEDALRE